MELDEPDTRVTLHEDKTYYLSAAQTYGPDVETIVHEEDTQPITEPIIAPLKVKGYDLFEKKAPETVYSHELLTGMMHHPGLMRNVAVVGELHHGKTSTVDRMIERTHAKPWMPSDFGNESTKGAQGAKGAPPTKADPARAAQRRYTDARVDEQKRGLSIKATPSTLLLQTSREKHYLLNLLDVPGHPNFRDEASAALRLADGVLFVVDAVDGLVAGAEALLRHALAEHLHVVLLINKVDRLILELKLPPQDAYFKLRTVIEDVNAAVEALSGGSHPPLAPEENSVVFASSELDFAFTLASFSGIYADHFGGIAPKSLARRLWGDVYFHPDSRAFRRSQPPGGAPRSFVQFVLEPLYKLVTQTISANEAELHDTLGVLHVPLRRNEARLDPKPLLKLVLSRFFEEAYHGLIDALVAHLPSPVDGARAKIEYAYTGALNDDDELARAMLSCDAGGPLMANVTKMYHTPDCDGFNAFGRVLSGTLRVGQRVSVLGESYSLEDQEDSAERTVGKLWLHQVMKIAVEPLNPSELPKMLEGLRKLNRAYPLLSTRVEESGEHVIIGTGELYLDCVMHDLRNVYADIEVKISDPIVCFCESIIETSSLKCVAASPNGRSQLSMVAEPLEEGLAEDIERGAVDIRWERKRLVDVLQRRYEWDLLAARSLWGFAPDSRGPNALIDDTLPSEVDKSLLETVRGFVLQGFQWSCREGPLCDEPVRGVKFKLLDASIAAEPMARGGGQIIPTARRVAFSALLTATPRLMEPIFAVNITAPMDCISAVHTVLGRRRGHVIWESPRPGTPLHDIRAHVPVIDSFGLETDMRSHTQGQAFCLSVFDHWAVVPGDPLDKTITLRSLEPAPLMHLAREFMVKTRRRKGLSDDVVVSKFFDEAMMVELAKQDADEAQFA